MAAVLLAAVGVVDAQAGTIKLQPVKNSLETFLTPATATPTINKNDVIPGLWGYLNGNLVLNKDEVVAGADYLVEFTLVGSESGWKNQLKQTGNMPHTWITEFSNNSTVGDSISYIHTATGLDNDFLDFQFETIAGAPQPQAILVNNNVDPDGPGTGYIRNGGALKPRTFFVSFCFDYPAVTAKDHQGLDYCNFEGNATEGNVAWLALDDSGAGPNDNHDDWVGFVRVTALNVPDGGAAAGLLGAALLGLGVLRRKFNL
jgi:hypothetical protein